MSAQLNESDRKLQNVLTVSSRHVSGFAECDASHNTADWPQSHCPEGLKRNRAISAR
jgi:hypothetical protein